MSKNRHVILVDNERVNLQGRELVDIILSPKYYWAKKEDLPVKYAYQAKTYAPSSFEGIIPEGNYNFLAKKADEGFWLYAYDDAYVIQELEKIGLNPSQIGDVYFAQNEFENLQRPIKVNSHEVLTNHNGSIIKVPNQMVEQKMQLGEYFVDNELSNFSVSLNKFSQFIDFKKAYSIIAVLSVLILFYLVEFIWLKNTQSNQEARRAQITKTYKMPSTKMQAKAILNQLDKKMNAQIALREKFSQIIKAPLLPNEYMTKVEYKSKKFKISVQISKDSQANILQRYFKKYFKIDDVNKKKNIVTYEVHYD